MMLIEQPLHRHALEPMLLPHTNTNDQTVASRAAAISVIIPTLNESANIALLLQRLHQVMTEAQLEYEAIVVDDHSTDGTPDIARETAALDNLPVTVMTKAGRPGKSFSLIEGFRAARYDVLAMLDGDLQYPPEALPELVQQLVQADIVVGDRRDSYHNASRMRSALSHTFRYALSRGLFGMDTDMQSGMKVFYREVYDQIRLQPSQWSLDIDLLTQATHQGYSVANVAIPYQQRYGGESKVTPLRVGAELVLAAVRLKLTLLTRDAVTGLVRIGALPQPETTVTVADIPAATPKIIAETRLVSERYTRWLEDHARQAISLKDYEETARYVEAALEPQQIGKTTVQTFTPLPKSVSAVRTVTPLQAIFLVLLTLGWAACLMWQGATTLIATVAVITCLYLADMLLTLALTVRGINHNPEERVPDDIVRAIDTKHWPRYTILCPLYKEAEIVPQFVKAMAALDYPADKLQILFLTEENDGATRDAIAAMRLPSRFEIVTVPDGEPRTKPRACNYGLLRATGEYVVIFDAEDIPDPLQLKKAVLAFANHGPELACVQAKLNFYNPAQNLLTRLFTAEYTHWFNMILPSLQMLGVALPLGGTSNHFRTSVLRRVGAWDPFNVTEDCDLGMRLAQSRYRTIMLDSTTLEEANSRPKNWMRQRSRWIKGYMQSYFIHMRRPWRYVREGRVADGLALQLVVGGKSAMLFINPILWVLLASYLIFPQQLLVTYHLLYPSAVYYMGMACLIFGNFLYVYTYLIACARYRHQGLMKWALLMPFYWAMMSIAGMIGLYQLIVKPFFWEKTQHGLHLRTPQFATPGGAVPALAWNAERLSQTDLQTIILAETAPAYAPANQE